MKSKQNKCEHIRLHAIHRIQFENGDEVPVTQSAAYLGSRVQHNGDHKNEIKARISAAWLTVMKLDLFWRKAPVTLKWKLRVLDAVINSKVLHGMETLVTSQSDYDKIDAFQVIIFRIILKIKHSYWSHVKNETVTATAENRAQHIEKQNIDIVPLSTKLKQRIVEFYGHILRSDPETDQIRAISIDEDGNRISAQKPWRSGRPKLRWYDTARPLVIQILEELNILPVTWRTDLTNTK